jgi:hypothetical protein
MHPLLSLSLVVPATVRLISHNLNLNNNVRDIRYCLLHQQLLLIVKAQPIHPSIHHGRSQRPIRDTSILIVRRSTNKAAQVVQRRVQSV